MARIKDFVRQELTLCIAFCAALISCFFVPPDATYIDYLDFRTLAVLYCLMVVTAGLRRAGTFSLLAHRLCDKAHSVRSLGFVLVLLSFVTSMLITNDVAILTFVPFTVVVLGLADQMRELSWVVVLQTVAANLGSMLTPMGNPQNLYLYGHYNMTMADFLMATLPVWLVSLAILCGLCFVLPKAPVNVFLGEQPTLSKNNFILYLLLGGVCMLTVLHILAWYYMLLCVVVVLLIFDRTGLKQADFFLLLTFVCFFVFAGNLTRLDAVNALLRGALNGHELLAGAAVSQVISNVPAALLLSGFTDNARGLLLGVDIGGLGTPIASLASLISLKLYAHAGHNENGHFMRKFLIVNFAMLAILLVLATSSSN